MKRPGFWPGVLLALVFTAPFFVAALWLGTTAKIVLAAAGLLLAGGLLPRREESIVHYALGVAGAVASLNLMKEALDFKGVLIWGVAFGLVFGLGSLLYPPPTR